MTPASIGYGRMHRGEQFSRMKKAEQGSTCSAFQLGQMMLYSMVYCRRTGKAFSLRRRCLSAHTGADEVSGRRVNNRGISLRQALHLIRVRCAHPPSPRGEGLSALSQVPVSVTPASIYLKFLRHPQFFHELLSAGNKIFIQKEVLNSNILDAILIPPRLHVVFYHNDFLEGIGNSD